MRRSFVGALGALLLLAGCSAAPLAPLVEPIAVFAAPPPGEIRGAAVTSDGFVVERGEDLVVISKTQARFLRAALAGPWAKTAFVGCALDGKTVVEVTHDGDLRALDAETGEPRPVTEPLDATRFEWLSFDPTRALAPDGSRIAYICDSEVAVFTWPEQRFLRLFHETGKIERVAFANVAKLIVATSATPELAIFDVETGHRDLWSRTIFDPWPSPSAFSVVAGGAALVVPSNQGIARFHVATSGRRPLEDLDESTPTLVMPQKLLVSAPCSASDRLVAIQAGWGSISVWDVETGTEVATFRSLANVTSIALLSKDGERLLVGGEGTLTLHEPRTGKLISTIAGSSKPPIRVLHFGRTLITLYEAQRLSVTCSSPELVIEWSRARATPLSADFLETYVRCFRECPPQDLELRPWYDGLLRVFDRTTHRVLWQEEISPTAVALSLEGAWCAIAQSGGIVEFRDARTGAPITAVRVASEPVIGALAFSPDDSELACGRGDGSIAIYATPTVLRLGRFPAAGAGKRPK